MKICPVCGKEYSDTITLCTADAAVLRSADDPLLGQTLAEKYLIEELIKRGGMGAVYRGKHVLMDKTVAIKVLRPSLAGDDAVVARFSREAKAASRISHPHAVNVTDFGEAENGVVFLVMEYLDGRTLKEIIRTEGPMPLARVIEIVRQVAGALDAAHRQGVVHRDLKSDNVMLSQTTGADWAKVLDFGIAKIQLPESFADADLTAPNLVVGTPQYMSPEQCSQSGAIDARSDVYSLGVIVYEMLTGNLPFTGESPTVIMMKQVQDQPPSILAAKPGLPAQIDLAIRKVLAKQPADRFQTAGEFSEALARAAEGSESLAAAVLPVADTRPNSPIADDDPDEITVIQPRPDSAAVHSRQEIPLPAPVTRAEPPTVRPWRIMIPAAIVMVLVFGVVFLLTRGSGQRPLDQSNSQGPIGLSADPNSQAVQPMGTPTGESERDIQAQPLPSSTLPPPPVKQNANTNENTNRRDELPPANISGEFGNEATPSPKSIKNANVPRESPTPKPSPALKTELPPAPAPTVKTVIKQSPTPQ
jgi:serine/threonine-protein kinase